jgi:hypothetical protein
VDRGSLVAVDWIAMAVPTITSVDPTIGPVFGRNAIEIAGTNFRLPPAPPATGPTYLDPIVPTVAVEFDGEPALGVEVLADTLLRVLVPSLDRGQHAITVTNLDDDGDPIVGETVTASDAYATKQPAITHESEHDITRLVRALIRELKRQVIDEVSLTVHTDYDDQTGDQLHTTHVASLPALLLVGPDLAENRFYSINEPPEYDDDTSVEGDFVRTRVPVTYDVEFEVIGVSNRTHEMLNLMGALLGFMESNKTLAMDRDPNDPALGRVSYELEFVDRPTTATRSNLSNLRHFTSRILIRGFDVEAQAGIASGTRANVPKHEIISGGKTTPEGVELEGANTLAVSSLVVRSIGSRQDP